MGNSKESMNLSQKIELIAHGNASGLYDSGLSFQTAYKMELENLKTWSDEEIESEYELRKEHLERGWVMKRKVKINILKTFGYVCLFIVFYKVMQHFGYDIGKPDNTLLWSALFSLEVE